MFENFQKMYIYSIVYILTEIQKNWKVRNQLLFRSTAFGDDIDRPLQKEDGSWTYFAADMAYHSHKISRKFDSLINILGADHSGYTKRIISATKAISNNKVDLISIQTINHLIFPII